jgi:hypothetical protein
MPDFLMEKVVMGQSVMKKGYSSLSLSLSLLKIQNAKIINNCQLDILGMQSPMMWWKISSY